MRVRPAPEYVVPLELLTVMVIEPVGMVTMVEVVLPDVTEIAQVDAGLRRPCGDRVAGARRDAAEGVGASGAGGAGRRSPRSRSGSSSPE